MANFSIALCILLVACGAQGANVNADESSAAVRINILQMLEELKAQIQAQLERLKNAIADAVGRVTDFTDNFNSAIQSRIEEFKANLQALSTNVQGVNTCIGQNSDLIGLAEEIASKSIFCALEVLRSLRAEYEALKTALEELANKLAAAKAQIEECFTDSKLWQSAKCSVSVWSSESNAIGSAFYDLVKQAGSLVIRISQIENELAACGARTALETLQNRLSSTVPQIKECISNLNAA